MFENLQVRKRSNGLYSGENLLYDFLLNFERYRMEEFVCFESLKRFLVLLVQNLYNL